MNDLDDRPTVVDASVAVKWVVREEFSDRALALLEESIRGDRPLTAPPLLPNEVVNAVYHKERRGRLTPDEAERAVARGLRFIARRIELRSPPDLTADAYAIAKAHGLPAIYDALYVVLARDLDAELWTDDRRLLAAVAPAVPRLRWLGDSPLPKPQRLNTCPLPSAPCPLVPTSPSRGTRCRRRASPP